MSSHARSASANEIHAEPDAEPHSDWISEEDWNNYIKEDPRVRLKLSSVVSIFRVPKFLKDTKIEAYVPQRVSLGPHHHGSAKLPQMGHHKGRAMRRMMKRFNTNMDFANHAMEEILKLEVEIRNSYEENIDCNGETLARMLILDGCFILQVLRTLNYWEAGQYYEPIFGGWKLRYAAYDILYDILMLENQVPWIVLRKLLEFEINSAVDVEQQLLDLEKQLLVLFYPFEEEGRFENFDIKQSNFHHLLGFLHTVVVSPPFNQDGRVDQGECNISIKCCRMCTRMLQHKSKSRDGINQREREDQGECGISMDCCSRQCIIMLQDKNKARDNISIPHAVELKNAGIKFKRCKGGIQEIKFDRDSATIFLPPICIQDKTEIVFRNLIAFEMCKPSHNNYVSHYVRVMDDLIDSHHDVALLGRMGVLTNGLGSDKEVADLFNGLCKDVTVNMEYVFDELTKKVNAHYNNKMKVQIAELVRDHFSSPWKALALVAATVALLLTAVQTIFPIIHK